MNLTPATRQPRAFVLIAILIVVMLSAMIALSLLFRMKAEETASAAGSGSEQAWSAAMSGVREAMRVAAAGADSQDVFDAPALFHERFVFDDGADRWHFTVFARGEEGAEFRFGLTDEAGKLNVNYAVEESLTRLPGVKPVLAQALLDYTDADSEPRPEGAEQEYYDALPQPYAIRNGPLATLDELLLVRGFTPAVLYGAGANPYRTAPTEEAVAVAPESGSAGGLRDFLTVSSVEPNTDADGAPRWNLNNPAEQFPTNDLPTSFPGYIAALRSNGVVIAYASELLDAKQKLKGTNGIEVEFASGVTKEELPLVLDRFTTVDDAELPGLINVNTAARAVLATVPGLDEPLAEAIVSARRNLPPERRKSLAWLVQENVLDAEQFRAVAPYLTTRGFQFSFRVIGYGVPSGRYRVLEVIVDTAHGKPVITYLRDITRLGLPFNLPSNDEPSASNGASPTRPVAADVRRRTSAQGWSLEHMNPPPLTPSLSPPRRRGEGARRAGEGWSGAAPFAALRTSACVSSSASSPRRLRVLARSSHPSFSQPLANETYGVRGLVPAFSRRLVAVVVARAGMARRAAPVRLCLAAKAARQSKRGQVPALQSLSCAPRRLHPECILACFTRASSDRTIHRRAVRSDG